MSPRICGGTWRSNQRHFLARNVRPCPHIGATPAVVKAAVWAPGLLACQVCARTTLVPDPTEELTGDQCRRVVGLLYAGLVAVGPVVLTYGRCHTCVTHRQHLRRACLRPTRRHSR